MMCRRNRWLIIGLSVGIPALVAGGFLLAVVLSSSSLSERATEIEQREIPSSWLVERGASGSPQAVVSSSDAEDPEGDKETEPGWAGARGVTPFVSKGSLVFVGDGRAFGAESYDLTVTEEGTTLTSSGHFAFKVAVATVRVTYDQTLRTDGGLRPVAYSLAFEAPLGFGRAVEATISADTATVLTGENRRDLPVDPNRVLVLGTFSTYALLLALFELRADEGAASFEVLMFGGPPDQARADEAGNDDLPAMRVERLDDALLEAGPIQLAADRYRITSDLGESILFAKGNEFLGLLAGEEDETLLVYRADFFPNGFAVAEW